MPETAPHILTSDRGFFHSLAYGVLFRPAHLKISLTVDNLLECPVFSKTLAWPDTLLHRKQVTEIKRRTIFWSDFLAAFTLF